MACALLVSTPAFAALGNDRYQLAATEKRLWLIESGTRESRCFTRTDKDPDQFDVLNVNGCIAQAVAIRDSLVILFDDHRIFESTEDGAWRPVRQLSYRRRPLRLATHDDELYAVVDAETALHFPLESPQPGLTGILTTSWYDHLMPQWWLVRRYGASWRRVLPSGLLTGQLTPTYPSPRFARTNTHYVIAARDTDGAKITTSWIPIDAPQLAQVRQLSVTGATDYWLLVSNHQLYLLVSSNDPTAANVQLYRAATESDGAQTWKPVTFKLPDLPLTDITRAIDAASFNQHLAFLLEDREQNVRLAFWLPTGQATETGFDVTQRIDDRDTAAKRGVTIHMIVTIIPLTLLALTLAFRHQALRTLPPLSPLVTQALFSQRLVGALIDLLPFVWAMAITLDLHVGNAFGDLLEWSFAGSEADQAAPINILIWWGASLFSYTIYMTVMECLTGRSIGKVLTRTQVVTVTLEKPTRKQLLLRNLTRPLELLPPWPLVIVIVLTLKRQRIGDTWADTMVITARRPSVKPPNHTVTFQKSNATDKQTTEPEPPGDDAPPADEAPPQNPAESDQPEQQPGESATENPPKEESSAGGNHRGE